MREDSVADVVLTLLEESRRREREQAGFYRSLAAQADEGGRWEDAERLNGLHADEQHHLSRLTARLLELGGTPLLAPPPPGDVPEVTAWEGEARKREEAEVSWYRSVLARELDPTTREMVREILASEEHHARELGGKWMSA